MHFSKGTVSLLFSATVSAIASNEGADVASVSFPPGTGRTAQGQGEDSYNSEPIGGSMVLSQSKLEGVTGLVDLYEGADAGILSRDSGAAHGSDDKTTPASSGTTTKPHAAFESELGATDFGLNDMAEVGILSHDKAIQGQGKPRPPSSSMKKRALAVLPTTSSLSIVSTTGIPSISLTTAFSLHCPAEKGYVDCVNGTVRTNTSTTCADACLLQGERKCCSGVYACTGFTGTVCKDGSCNGYAACYNASISSAVDSCKGGYSCDSARQLGSVINSCNGYGACQYAGLRSGTTRDVRYSCNQKYACHSIAYNGTIGNITSSCNADHACFLAGSPSPNGTGAVYSSLTSCCNTASECNKTNQYTLPAQCFSTTQVRYA